MEGGSRLLYIECRVIPLSTAVQVIGIVELAPIKFTWEPNDGVWESNDGVWEPNDEGMGTRFMRV